MDFALKRRFLVPRRKHIFLSLTWCSRSASSSSSSVSRLSLPSSSSWPPPFFFLLFYLRSLSEGLTISSSVSLLSCSAVYCLWFAQAHPCGCSFRQPSVTCRIARGSCGAVSRIHEAPRSPWATLILQHRPSPVGRTRRHACSLPDSSGS